jgi:hypothetical protein
MLTLKEKIDVLRTQAEAGLKLANWYDKQIAAHGAAKVEAFYGKYLGLNHIERKAEFDGLQLRRQPRESEALCVKGVATAQNDAQAQVSSLLLQLRSQLISDGLTGIATLKPAKYHSLTLQVPPSYRQRLKDRLKLVYREGRRLVVRELQQKAVTTANDDFDELDTLTDVTDTRVANDVQARIIAAAARGTLAGLVGVALLDFIRTEMTTGSTAYIEKIATGAANQTLSIGRSDEAEQHSIDRVEYSALLDNNVCGPCAADDGETAATEDALTPAPNPDCEGGDYCRCFHVYISS